LHKKLVLRITRNASAALHDAQRQLPEGQVELLPIISEPLRIELHFEINLPHLSGHPFFSRYGELFPAVMRRVCHLAMSTMRVSCGDILFSVGEIPANPKMFVVSDGEFKYTTRNGDNITVGPKRWVAEPTLWCNWSHQGVFCARVDSVLKVVDAVKFQNIVTHFKHDDDKSFDPKDYAQKFIEALNETSVADNVSDLPLQKLLDQPILRQTRGKMRRQSIAVVALNTRQRFFGVQ